MNFRDFLKQGEQQPTDNKPEDGDAPTDNNSGEGGNPDNGNPEDKKED